METKMLQVGNLTIAYIEKNPGASHTIFFIHGNSVSKRCWRKQYNNSLLDNYRMVAIDLPSHGESGVIDEKDCNLPAIGSIMYNAVNLLSDGKPFLLAGISLSTNIIAEMLVHDIYPAGLLLAGPCIVGKDHLPGNFIKENTHVGVVFTDVAAEQDVLSYAEETSSSSEISDINIFIEDYHAVKPSFRSLLAQSIVSATYSDEIDLLIQRNIPCCVVFGKEELVVDADYLDSTKLPLWSNRIYKLENASHLVNIDQPEQFNQLLKSFADDIFK